VHSRSICKRKKSLHVVTSSHVTCIGRRWRHGCRGWRLRLTVG